MRPIPYVQPDPQGWMAKFRYSIPLRVRYSETDMLGHLNNVSYFIYFEQGRVDYLEHLGLTDTLFNDEAVTVVADLECQYLAQVRIKDPLLLYVRTAKMGRSSLDIEYALTDANTGEPKAVGRGAMVHIGVKTGKSVPLPDDARKKIALFEDTGLEG